MTEDSFHDKVQFHQTWYYLHLFYILEKDDNATMQGIKVRTHVRETYVVIPSVVVRVVDDRSTQTSGWVDSSSCNGDGCQVYQKYGEPNGKRSKHLAGVQGVTTRHQITPSSSSSSLLATTFKQHFNIRVLPDVPNVAIYGNTRALN